MNIFPRINSWLVSIFKKSKYKEPRKPIDKKIPAICEFVGCDNHLVFPKNFYCKYCKEYHCDKHRLPEEHECPNPSSPYNNWRK